MTTRTAQSKMEAIRLYREIPVGERSLADHVRAAVAGATEAEAAVRQATGKTGGWAVVESSCSSNRRTIYGRYDTLQQAFARRQGVNQIVIARDNLSDDGKWVYADIRHLMVSSDGWTAVVPA